MCMPSSLLLSAVGDSHGDRLTEHAIREVKGQEAE